MGHNNNNIKPHNDCWWHHQDLQWSSNKWVREKSVNTSEYAFQMCRAVTLQVNTLADGQLGTGWPHRHAPRERAGEGRRRQEEKEGWDTAGEKRGGGEGWRTRGEGSALRDPSQDQVTLRTRVAWQAGYSRDRRRKRGGKGQEGGIAREDWDWLLPSCPSLVWPPRRLLQPLWISVWHRPVSSWEQTEIWTERREDGRTQREKEGKDRQRHQKWGTDGDFTCVSGPSPDPLKSTKSLPVQGLAYLKGGFSQNITVSVDAGGAVCLPAVGFKRLTTWVWLIQQKKVSHLPLHKKTPHQKMNFNMG